MKRLRSLVLGLFALCSMVGMAQEAEADDTGYIVKVGQVASDFTVTVLPSVSVTVGPLRFLISVARWLCCSLRQAGVVYAVRRCLLSKRIYGRSISPIRISC